MNNLFKSVVVFFIFSPVLFASEEPINDNDQSVFDFVVVKEGANKEILASQRIDFDQERVAVLHYTQLKDTHVFCTSEHGKKIPKTLRFERLVDVHISKALSKSHLFSVRWVTKNPRDIQENAILAPFDSLCKYGQGPQREDVFSTTLSIPKEEGVTSASVNIDEVKYTIKSRRHK